MIDVFTFRQGRNKSKVHVAARALEWLNVSSHIDITLVLHYTWLNQSHICVIVIYTDICHTQFFLNFIQQILVN